jgi:vacuolar iron transporter family protein
VGAAALAAGWSHRHRDVAGGWLRPTVFGAVEGLVTNASLIAGLGGGGASEHTVVLSGVAALVAGAFSMGTGEYVSVTNQNELVHAEVNVERLRQLALGAVAVAVTFAVGSLIGSQGR